MPAPDDSTRRWTKLRDALAGAAVVAATSSPEGGRRYWSSGQLSGRAVTRSTVFYVASVTKQLVATLVALDVIGGRIDPRASITSHLAMLPGWTEPVGVRHLIHHTAALPQPPALAAALGRTKDVAGWSGLDNAAVLAGLARVTPPATPPGRQFSYDNTGYVVLAELLRAVHGRDLAELARSEVFTPLGLTGSRIGGDPPVLLPGHVPPPATTGDGGWWTCASDLLTWLEALNQQRFGVEATALIQAPGRLDDGTVLDYAWGVGPRPGPAGTRYLHGGEWPGWCATTVRQPETETAAVVLATTEDMPTVSAAAQELHDLLR